MKIFSIALTSLLLLASGLLQAETRYVTDVAQITLRTGESTSHKILRILPSGTAVEVLAPDNKETGYTKVQAKGSTGFILTNKLMRQPSARDQLAALKQEIEDLKAAPGELRKTLADLQQQHRELQTAHSELQGIKKKQEQELQGIQRTASNAIRIANERNELRTQVASLTRQVEELKQENRDLGNKATRDWFLIGAGVIIAGILIGLILPHMRFRRRRDNWGSL
jgi:SH3 domain protein